MNNQLQGECQELWGLLKNMPGATVSEFNTPDLTQTAIKESQPAEAMFPDKTNIAKLDKQFPNLSEISVISMDGGDSSFISSCDPAQPKDVESSASILRRLAPSHAMRTHRRKRISMGLPIAFLAPTPISEKVTPSEYDEKSSVIFFTPLNQSKEK